MILTSFIPKHNQRWGTMHSWNSEINEIKNFNNERSAYVRRHLEEMFDLPEKKFFFKNFSIKFKKLKLAPLLLMIIYGQDPTILTDFYQSNSKKRIPIFKVGRKFNYTQRNKS